MGSSYIHLENPGFVDLFGTQLVPGFCMDDTEIAERSFAACRVSYNRQNTDRQFDKIVSSGETSSIDSRPQKN
jgi:hypothetical protein